MAGGELEPGELAEALQVDVSEVRAAAGTLRKLAKVLVRVEDGHLLYKLPEHSGSRIPGSAAQVIGERRKAAEKPVVTKPETAATPQSMTEAPMPKTTTKATVTRDQVLALVRETPGLTCDSIAKRLGDVELAGRVSTVLSKLASQGLVQRASTKRPYCYSAIDANAEKPAKATPSACPATKCGAWSISSRSRSTSGRGRRHERIQGRFSRRNS